jgi:hypothetical protein
MKLYRPVFVTLKLVLACAPAKRVFSSAGHLSDIVDRIKICVSLLDVLSIKTACKIFFPVTDCK